jgi:hypothetical protein
MLTTFLLVGHLVVDIDSVVTPPPCVTVTTVVTVATVTVTVTVTSVRITVTIVTNTARERRILTQLTAPCSIVTLTRIACVACVITMIHLVTTRDDFTMSSIISLMTRDDLMTSRERVTPDNHYHCTHRYSSMCRLRRHETLTSCTHIGVFNTNTCSNKEILMRCMNVDCVQRW